MIENYFKKMKACCVQELPKRIQKLEACTTPTEEAKCDASLFLWKYFLDEDGNPDRTKTPDLILLAGYTDKSLALTGRTERVPALHVADGGLGGASNVTVVGWDRERVNKKAHEIDMEQSLGRGILRLSHDWDRQMMSHQTYVEELRKNAEILDPGGGRLFKTHGTVGIYVMKCEAIQHDWPVLSKQLRLRMIHSRRLAVFDLGIIVGLMVLGKTQEHVTKRLQVGNWNNSSIDPEDTDDEGENEDASSDEEDSNEERGSESSRDSDYNVGDEPDTPIDLTLDQSVKRQKIKSTHPRRVHFQWRGYNTMSGAIQFDPQHRNMGYLDFANDGVTTFEGNIFMDVMGCELSFQGYKVPGMGGPATIDWNALSHLASEREKARDMW